MHHRLWNARSSSKFKKSPSKYEGLDSQRSRQDLNVNVDQFKVPSPNKSALLSRDANDPIGKRSIFPDESLNKPIQKQNSSDARTEPTDNNFKYYREKPAVQLPHSNLTTNKNRRPDIQASNLTPQHESDAKAVDKIQKKPLKGKKLPKEQAKRDKRLLVKDLSKRPIREAANKKDETVSENRDPLSRSRTPEARQDPKDINKFDFSNIVSISRPVVYNQNEELTKVKVIPKIKK